ncbi:MAG: CRISPR-associated endoribonuclease Cas6 [Hyphomicrobiales bacterium]
MRIQLEFELSGARQLLTFNYQYPISCWIYKVLDQGDGKFAKFLHNSGYQLDNGKQFKLFTFSSLRFPRGTTEVNKRLPAYLSVESRKAYLDISFYLPEQMNPFVMGLFKDQDVQIGDLRSVLRMKVKNVEMKESPALTESGSVNMRAKTPVVLGDQKADEQYEQYIIPLHGDYAGIMKQSILDKCKAANIEVSDPDQIEFRVTKLETRTSLQHIKADTSAATKVRGYYYNFEINAPKKVYELILAAGIGSMNSLGFGMCELVSEN